MTKKNSGDEEAMTGTSSVEVVAMESTTTPPSGKKVPFSQFIANNTTSYKCDVNQSVNNIDSKGTVYIKAGMMKGTFTSTVAGKEMTANMIEKDGYTYSWSSVMPTVGYKVKVAANQTGSTTAQASGSYSWNSDQIGDYNCAVETIDDSQFTLPTTVTFQTMN